VSNRLASSTSPYLLQHKDNPVDWWPWGQEALQLAQTSDRPSCSRSVTPRVTGASARQTLALRWVEADSHDRKLEAHDLCLRIADVEANI
jgi:hypothetical protein